MNPKRAHSVYNVNGPQAELRQYASLHSELGNKSKSKAEVNSVELSRSPGEDIFSQMNQDNLRYIQK